MGIGIKQFILSGKLSEENNLLISATDNYFKALIHAVDLYLLGLIGKIPDNHTERFRILEAENSDVYRIVDELFRLYVKSYRSNISKEEFTKVKDGLKQILRLTKLEEEFVKYLQ